MCCEGENPYDSRERSDALPDALPRGSRLRETAEFRGAPIGNQSNLFVNSNELQLIVLYNFITLLNTKKRPTAKLLERLYHYSASANTL